jgi:hypothetical protein
MPRKSMMRSLKPREKGQLDQFVETHYQKLMGYALHQRRGDEEAAEILLHDALVDLYEGRRVLDFSQHPLAYFQHILRSVKTRVKDSRQLSFEDGVDVSTKNGASDKQCIRESMEVLDGMSYPPFDIESLDRDKRYQHYVRIKKTFRPRRQWLLTHLEANVPTKNIYVMYCKKWDSPISMANFRAEVSHVLQLVRTKVAAHLQDAG